MVASSLSLSLPWLIVSSVFLEQTGGGDEAGSEAITIKVKEHTGEEMQFKVKKTTRMEKIFEAYAGSYL